MKFSKFEIEVNLSLRAVKIFMGFDIPAKKAIIFNDGTGKWSTTTLASIGLAVKNALLIPEKTANKYLYVDSFTLSQNEILASLEKATGAKWDAEHVDAEEQKAAGLAKMAAGDHSGAMSLIRYINTVEGHGGNFATLKENANELLGLPKLELDEVIEGLRLRRVSLENARDGKNLRNKKFRSHFSSVILYE